MSLSIIETEVGELMIETLNLEIDVSEIDSKDYLFGEGLGLDSIDALELAMAITKKYGFQLRSDDTNNKQIFRSLKNLSDYIQSHSS